MYCIINHNMIDHGSEHPSLALGYFCTVNLLIYLHYQQSHNRFKLLNLTNF